MTASDPGTSVVRGVRQRLKAGGVEGDDWGRGFEAHPFGVRQRVWADPPVSGAGDQGWRVQVRTGFVRAFHGDLAQLGALSLEMALPALSGMVRATEDPTRLELASTLHVHAGNAGWATDFLIRAARLQAAEAFLLSRSSALLASGAAPDVVTPSTVDPAGPELLAEVLHVGPPGVAPSDAAEIAECVGVLATIPLARAAATERGLNALFPAEEPWLGGGPGVLEIEAGAESAVLGPGLRVRLTMSRGGGVDDALTLNEREAAFGSLTDLLGGWSADEGVLQHTAFFPNAFHARDLALHVAAASARRARWARGWPPRAEPGASGER